MMSLIITQCAMQLDIMAVFVLKMMFMCMCVWVWLMGSTLDVWNFGVFVHTWTASVV
jgi:hypothetical protein